ncbi:MAG: two-component sensor histidine kinase [Ruminococcus sp.]|nr:two-component sensor histidine kinase [Ruminococcus sp.]
MKKKIFLGTFFACLAVILSCSFLISAFLFNYYSDQQEEGLKTQLSYLVHMAENHDIEHIKSFTGDQEIILMDINGQISASNRSHSSVSHLALNEVFEEAHTQGEGHYAKQINLSQRQLLLSVKLQNGSILCICDTQHTYISLVKNITGYVTVVLLAAAVISLFLARRLSNRILRPVLELDLSTPDKSKVYPELVPFVEKISEQNDEIKRRVSHIKDEHEAQDKMRREFTANVSHELKTPLTSISGYAELIRDGLAKTEDIPRFAGKIHDESTRMINLVGDIIKLSQLDEKDISVTIERIDLYECCSAVIHNLEHQAEKKNVSFTLTGEHCEISGAEVIIEEIVHNICDNAIKYNKENGSVHVSIRQCIDGVELAVTDTGIGIAKDDLDHVFERFYRADKSHSKEIGGTGLGLSIVKHGAKFHNAYVSIESELNVGTTIRILF